MIVQESAPAMTQEERPARPENQDVEAVNPSHEVARNKALTIERKRLAGSTNCLNCGTPLQGPFCHYCGQPDKSLVRFFPALLRELLEDFADFDSRFMRTIKPLLFKPGQLTRDYLDGRRFRYVPPLRLYIFSSLALFFLLAVFAGNALTISTDPHDDEHRLEISLNEEERAEVNEALDDLEEVRPGLSSGLDLHLDSPSQTGESDGDESNEVKFEWNGKPWHVENNPVEFSWLPDWVNRRLNQEIADSPQKGKAIERNPNLIMEKVLDVLPGTMFVLLPLVALLLKIWYLFARRYYVEHLIFALHNHAFVFTTFILILLISTVAEWREPLGEGPLNTAAAWVETILLVWIPVYMLIALKRVYQQGWWLTIGKYMAIGTSYVCILGFATAFVALTAFIML